MILNRIGQVWGNIKERTEEEIQAIEKDYAEISAEPKPPLDREKFAKQLVNSHIDGLLSNPEISDMAKMAIKNQLINEELITSIRHGYKGQLRGQYRK